MNQKKQKQFLWMEITGEDTMKIALSTKFMRFSKSFVVISAIFTTSSHEKLFLWISKEWFREIQSTPVKML